MSTSFPLALLVASLLTLPLVAQQSPAPVVPTDTVALTPEQRATRARYAKDLADLERMKEKFRRQQERKLRGEERGGDVSAWDDDVITPQPTASAFIQPQPPADTTTVPSTVRSGLYGDRQAAQPDNANYRQEEELEAMRAQLRKSRGEAEPTPAYPRVVVPRQEAQLTSKSPASAPVATPAVTPAAVDASSAAIVFISNTAYPNSSGYNALDALVTTIRNASSVVEIRVHTGRELDRRAAQLLSEERATTIRNYLIEAGIAPANFKVIGFGNHESAAGERVEVLTAQ